MGRCCFEPKHLLCVLKNREIMHPTRCRCREKHMCHCKSLKTELGVPSAVKNLYHAAAKGLVHGKQQYNSAKHRSDIAAVEKDLESYIDKHPAEAGRIKDAIALLKQEIEKMDAENKQELDNQGKDVKQYLVNLRL